MYNECKAVARDRVCVVPAVSLAHAQETTLPLHFHHFPFLSLRVGLFEIRFRCVTLAGLELSMKTRLASNS